MKLEPIYGYGWSAPDRPGTRDTPEPFVIRIAQSTEGVFSGVVDTVGHEFEGLLMRLSNRHEQPDGIVNVEVEGAANGWAMAT